MTRSRSSSSYGWNGGEYVNLGDGCGGCGTSSFVIAFIIFALFYYLFVWLYEQIGLIGYTIIFILLIIIVIDKIGKSRSEAKASYKYFRKMIASQIVNNLTSFKYYKFDYFKLQNEEPEYARFINQLRKLRRSLDFVKKNMKKNEKNTFERMELAEKEYRIILKQYGKIIEEDVLREIIQKFNQEKTTFHTNYHVKIMEKYEKNIKKFKTKKTKLKYLKLLIEEIKRAKDNKHFDNNKVYNFDANRKEFEKELIRK
ncbi:MAG: hypothetical protein HND52_18445 [Ignavibacteriae bacterium]|nr:hypothetical protein [Ignavibacteriota bacterium]NOG99944.1 hypothetical protein [Ignavibacteriota bacterium]